MQGRLPRTALEVQIAAILDTSNTILNKADNSMTRRSEASPERLCMFPTAPHSREARIPPHRSANATLSFFRNGKTGCVPTPSQHILFFHRSEMKEPSHSIFSPLGDEREVILRRAFGLKSPKLCKFLQAPVPFSRIQDDALGMAIITPEVQVGAHFPRPLGQVPKCHRSQIRGA
jgi:hypothetical protein